MQDDGGKVLGAESTRKRRLWSLGQGALSDVDPLQAVSPHSQIRSHLCANSAQGSRASPVLPEDILPGAAQRLDLDHRGLGSQAVMYD